MNEQAPVYRVEISGWDVNEEFFVERSALQWDEGEQRRVLIRKRVRRGALVFIRLLQDATASRTYPVAYRAQQVRECEGGSSFELSLSQVWPTASNESGGSTTDFEAVKSRAMGVN
ncbi:MAG TPA: hypothetical protein VMV61_05745 [Patescibacteria group bacterium]|nr:hypothetical protein [Patescibacteria group bacterium]